MKRTATGLRVWANYYQGAEIDFSTMERMVAAWNASDWPRYMVCGDPVVCDTIEDQVASRRRFLHQYDDEEEYDGEVK